MARGSEAQVAKKYLSTLIGGKAMGCTKCDRGLNWERSHSSPSKSSPELVDRQGAVQHFWIFVWGMGIFNVRKHIGLIGGGGGQKVAASVFI